VVLQTYLLSIHTLSCYLFLFLLSTAQHFQMFLIPYIKNAIQQTLQTKFLPNRNTRSPIQKKIKLILFRETQIVCCEDHIKTHKYIIWTEMLRCLLLESHKTHKYIMWTEMLRCLLLGSHKTHKYIMWTEMLRCLLLGAHKTHKYIVDRNV
jgi:hypothetical protein